MAPFEAAGSEGEQPWGGGLRPLPPPGRGKAKSLESPEPSPGLSPSAPSRRRSGTTGTAVWVCEPQRRGSARAAALAFWDLPGDWGDGGRLGTSSLEGEQWGSRLLVLILPNAPTPEAHQALLHREAAPGGYRSELRLQRQLSGQWELEAKAGAVCVWGVGGRRA